MTMGDGLEKLLRERLRDHETDVDPGTWQAIQERLAAATATDGDPVSELFREHLQGHEMDVDPGVWNGLSERLGHGAPAGKPFGWGKVAAGAAVLLVAGAAYLMTSTEGTDADPGTTVAETRTHEASVTAAEPADGNEPANGTAGQEDLSLSTQEAVRTVPAEADRGTPASNDPEEANNDSGGDRPDAIPQAPAPTGGAGEEDPPGAALVDDLFERLTDETKEKARLAAQREALPPPARPEPVPQEQPPSAPSQPLPQLYMPVSFTPNGDGLNDTYVVEGEGFARIRVRVFSVRTNQLVFTSDDNEPWDGGNCEDGYYVVAAEAITDDQRPVAKSQVVLLDRTPR